MREAINQPNQYSSQFSFDWLTTSSMRHRSSPVNYSGCHCLSSSSKLNALLQALALCTLELGWGGKLPARQPVCHSSYLHDCVVGRDEDCEQVKVSGGEDQGEQHLRLPRDACGERKRGAGSARKSAVKSSWPQQTSGSQRSDRKCYDFHIFCFYDSTVRADICGAQWVRFKDAGWCLIGGAGSRLPC